MKIYFASDHAGFELKQRLMAFAESLGHEIEDKGDLSPTPTDDYPDFISFAAKEVSQDPSKRAIVVGGSGEGEAVMANRFRDVRAAVYYGGNLEIVRLSRSHNDSNVLSLGARFVSEDEAKEAVRIWLKEPFSGDERHVRRIKKIEEISHA